MDSERVAQELAQIHRTLAAHLRSDDQFLGEMREDLKGLRKDMVEMRRDFDVHKQVYASDQNQWQKHFSTDRGTSRQQDSQLHHGLNGNAPKVVYTAVGAALAFSVIWEALRHVLEALPKFLIK